MKSINNIKIIGSYESTLIKLYLAAFFQLKPGSEILK